MTCWQMHLKYIQICAFQKQMNKLLTVYEQGSEHGNWMKCHSETLIELRIFIYWIVNDGMISSNTKKGNIHCFLMSKM